LSQKIVVGFYYEKTISFNNTQSQIALVMAFANAMHFDCVEDNVTNSILLPQEITPLANMK
jgi:hypothetical protein